MNTYTYN